MKKIPLTQGQEVIVDDEDFEWLNQWKWYAQKGGHTWYAVRCDRGGSALVSVLMHREILKAPKGFDVDHRDGNGLNNTRSNIRVCTHSQNMMNRGRQANKTTKFKGVYKHGNGWRAQLKKNGKNMHYGTYSTPDAAARAYDAAAKDEFGEFASPNFPDTDTIP
jgi:hypothetical protein